MNVFRRMYRTSLPQDPEAWHRAFVLFAYATSYKITPAGNPEVVILGWVERRSIDHMDIGPYRFHRYEYRTGPAPAHVAH